MNRLTLKNQFKRNLQELLRKIDKELEKPQREPYVENDPYRTPHEHDTRLLFINELLRCLGWKLGISGNVLEEARLQADTTKFMDYIGITDIERSPLLLVEAKAWNKPDISATIHNVDKVSSDADLIASAIKHIREGKSKSEGPIIAQWDDYLRQVHGYVRTLYQKYEHQLPRAVIISGNWMVIFSNPVETFLGVASSNDIIVFKRSQYLEKATEIFELLHRSTLTECPPIPLRPTQLRQYVDLNGVVALFRGVHIHYEKSGSTFFAPHPRILVYPAIFVTRDDDAIFTVIKDETYLTLDYQKDGNGRNSLSPHVDEISTLSDKLVSTCEAELGGSLPLAECSRFPGFDNGGMKKSPIRDLHEPDEWLVVTGLEVHFLRAEPRIERCQFHSWKNCGKDAASSSAINVRRVEPPAFFVDNQPHHCAHQGVLDRRDKRCLIQPIDSRICCQACGFLEYCWSPEERAKLPCGK